jgi:hypothetical protein
MACDAVVMAFAVVRQCVTAGSTMHWQVTPLSIVGLPGVATLWLAQLFASMLAAANKVLHGAEAI